MSEEEEEDEDEEDEDDEDDEDAITNADPARAADEGVGSARMRARSRRATTAAEMGRLAGGGASAIGACVG